jgi:peroxiredoxin
MGSPAPVFALQDLTGRPWDLAGLLGAGKPILLIFLSPRCPSCRPLAGDVAEWQSEHGRFITIVIISEGTITENAEVFGKLNIDHFLLEAQHQVRDSYGCPSTPGAVTIGSDGIATSPMTMGTHAVHELWLRLVHKEQAQSAAEVAR